jgi:hypothetical protein
MNFGAPLLRNDFDLSDFDELIDYCGGTVGVLGLSTFWVVKMRNSVPFN